jgi:hypothetical protein
MFPVVRRALALAPFGRGRQRVGGDAERAAKEETERAATGGGLNERPSELIKAGGVHGRPPGVRCHTPAACRGVLRTLALPVVMSNSAR